MPTAVREERSLAELFRDLSTEASVLVRQEVALAKTELAEKTSRLGVRAGQLAVGGAVALLGGLTLLTAAVVGLGLVLDSFLSAELSAFLSPLVIGAVLAAVGYGMVRKSLDSLRREGVVPQVTKDTLQENTEWLKGRIS